MKTKTLNIFHMDFNFVCLKKDFIKDFLMKLAEMGFNAVLWEIEDKVRLETCRECIWPEAMSKKDFKDILDYSRKLGLEPIPLLQTIGHAEYILKHFHYHQLRELPERHDCYCTSNPNVRKFLTELIEEYLNLFGDIRYFHLGGDEAYVFASCPKCSAYAKKYGKNRLYANHITQIAKPILKKSIRPGIWNDMIMEYPEEIDLIPKDFVIWDWNYWGKEEPPETLRTRNFGILERGKIPEEVLEAMPEILDENGNFDPFYSVKIEKKYGFHIILCSASRSYGDNVFCPSRQHPSNIAAVARTVLRENLLGNCVTSWAVRLNDLILQIPYIAVAGAIMNSHNAASGNHSGTLLSGCCKKLFGIESKNFIRAINILGESYMLIQLYSGIQWTGMKDSIPAPKKFLENKIKKLSKNKAEWKQLNDEIKRGLKNVPEAMRLLSDFANQIKNNYSIVEFWWTAANLLFMQLLTVNKITKKNIDYDFLDVIRFHKCQYIRFLERHETPLSASKNAALLFDPLIEFVETYL